MGRVRRLGPVSVRQPATPSVGLTTSFDEFADVFVIVAKIFNTADIMALGRHGHMLSGIARTIHVARDSHSPYLAP